MTNIKSYKYEEEKTLQRHLLYKMASLALFFSVNFCLLREMKNSRNTHFDSDVTLSNNPFPPDKHLYVDIGFHRA